MSKREKRALWLMNHTTLRKFEVPMLIDMGFEVYCPNMFPYDEGNMSASVTREYDSTLTINSQILEKLNETDFYNEIPREILELISQEFDIVFMGFFPEQFRSIVNHFAGIIVFQPFGLARGNTYTDILNRIIGPQIFDAIRKAGNRFIFGQSYKNLAEIECKLFQDRAVYLPIGLQNAYVQNKWVGGDNRILFVCPRIYSTEYFGNIYKKFKKDFEKFDYLVGGAQPINNSDDPRVLGFVDEQTYEYIMSHLGVMFYHSQENRHLHYHPIEAIKNGMPLIYMGNGMLDELGGKNLPGRCKTTAEARKKITRIFNGDKKFIQNVVKSQAVLLKSFTYEYCKTHWDKAFETIDQEIIRNKKVRQTSKTKRIAIILPEGYIGGVLDVTLRLIRAIKHGIEDHNSDTQLVFGYIDLPVFKERDYFAPIREMGIPIRPYKWLCASQVYLKNYAQLIGSGDIITDGEQYYLMDDGIQMFEDCDGFVFAVDRCPGRLFLTKPHVVLIHDYLQRYMTYVYNHFYEDCVLHLARTAVRTLTMSPPTYKDAIMYAGIPEKKLALIPLMFDLMSVDSHVATQHSKEQEEYFLWSTNLGEHKNHITAVRALSAYYSAGGKLKCYMTGVGTDLFDPGNKESASEYVMKVRRLIHKESLTDHIKFCGNMSKEKYVEVLRHAKFFMHPGLIDNGNMTAVDAASVGVPTITSDYPQMKFYDDYMHLNMRFFNPYDVNSLKNALLKTEQDYNEMKKKLPTREELRKYTISCTYNKIYAAIEEAFKLNRRISQ